MFLPHLYDVCTGPGFRLILFSGGLVHIIVGPENNIDNLAKIAISDLLGLFPKTTYLFKSFPGKGSYFRAHFSRIHTSLKQTSCQLSRRVSLSGLIP